MKKNTFKDLFYLRGNHVNKDGTSAIMIRISIDGEIEQLTSKLYVDYTLKYSWSALNHIYLTPK